MYSGSICALVTPFTADDALDLTALRRLIDWHVEAGSAALVLAGSTGESAALDEAELLTLWSQAVQMAEGRIPLIAGTGTSSTHRSCRLTRLAIDCGMQAALVVTPAYVRPTQDGLFRHYASVADQGLPVLLYNVPSRTACDLLPATVERLLAHPGVVGIKEALPDLARIDALLAFKSVRPAFAVLSGDDPTALQALTAGADGVVSVAANAVPRRFAQMVAAARSGHPELARQLDASMQTLYAALACESNPIPVKSALAMLGLLDGRLRLPLTTLEAINEPLLREALAGLREAPTAVA